MAGAADRDAQQWEGKDSYLGIRCPKADLIMLTLRGHVHAGPQIPEFAEAVNREIQRAGSCGVYFDLGDLTGYDSQLRIVITAMLKANLDAVTELVVFTESKIVRMGVTVARLALPKLELVERDEFMRRCAAAGG